MSGREILRIVFLCNRATREIANVRYHKVVVSCCFIHVFITLQSNPSFLCKKVLSRNEWEESQGKSKAPISGCKARARLARRPRMLVTGEWGEVALLIRLLLLEGHPLALK